MKRPSALGRRIPLAHPATPAGLFVRHPASNTPSRRRLIWPPTLDSASRQFPGQWHVDVFRRQSARLKQPILPCGSDSITAWECCFLNVSLTQLRGNEEYEIKLLHYRL